MTQKSTPKRLVIKEMINKGDCTKDILKADLKMSAASLATNFTYLRLMGFYPIADDKGILSFTDEAGWETLQTEKAEKASTKKSTSTKTPQEQYDAIVSRRDRAAKAVNVAEKRATDNSDDELLDLRYQKADIESQIVMIELQKIVDKFGDEIDTTVKEEEIAKDVVEETTDNETADDLV